MSCVYLVPTPIGNLGDITARALEILSAVDFIAAEDTRVARKLLSHFNIKKPVISCFEHNEAARCSEIIERVANGESCALVSDAGTPAISDPGELVVENCIERGIAVISLPGACAAVCALAASGMPTNRFCFEGFLSVNKKNRREHLESLKNETRTMVFYEAPHKLLRTLHDMYAVFGDRKITLCRELTKIHEEYIRTTLSGAISYYEKTGPRGEFVLIIAGAKALKAEKLSPEALDFTKGVRDVIKDAKTAGIGRNAAYRAALEAKKGMEK